MEQLSEELRQLSVQASQAENSLNKPAKNFRIEEDGIATLFKIDIKPGSVVYRYDVEVFRMDSKGQPRSLAKGADDGQRSQNQTICRVLVRLAFEKSQHFGWGSQDETTYVYDFKTMLWTPKPIELKGVSMQPCALAGGPVLGAGPGDRTLGA
ncbi:hypothetical protein AAVH_26929 [Aphelenchoides avenae]|nr:hypothetical protein AAVH_26929 [Aphelenchus avenae]